MVCLLAGVVQRMINREARLRGNTPTSPLFVYPLGHSVTKSGVFLCQGEGQFDPSLKPIESDGISAKPPT